MKTFPGIFDLPDPNSQETFMEIFVPSTTIYLLWAVAYILYMYFVGRYHGLPDSKYDSSPRYTYRTNKLFASICRFDDRTIESRQSMTPILIHQTFHAILVIAQTAFSCLMWHHFWVHSVFCIFILSVCAYNGAMRYYNMMTKYFIKSLEKIERMESSEKLAKI